MTSRQPQVSCIVGPCGRRARRKQVITKIVKRRNRSCTGPGHIGRAWRPRVPYHPGMPQVSAEEQPGDPRWSLPSKPTHLSGSNRCCRQKSLRCYSSNSRLPHTPAAFPRKKQRSGCCREQTWLSALLRSRSKCPPRALSRRGSPSARRDSPCRDAQDRRSRGRKIRFVICGCNIAVRMPLALAIASMVSEEVTVIGAVYSRAGVSPSTK